MHRGGHQKNDPQSLFPEGQHREKDNVKGLTRRGSEKGTKKQGGKINFAEKK